MKKPAKPATAKGKKAEKVVKPIRFVSVAELEEIMERQRQLMLDAIFGRASNTVTPAVGRGAKK